MDVKLFYVFSFCWGGGGGVVHEKSYHMLTVHKHKVGAVFFCY